MANVSKRSRARRARTSGASRSNAARSCATAGGGVFMSAPSMRSMDDGASTSSRRGRRIRSTRLLGGSRSAPTWRARWRPAGERQLHGSGDALSTGAVKSETGLATSADGLRWTWEGKVLAAATKGWDRFTARLTTAFRSGEGWAGLYDGSADVGQNYEERCGLAQSSDLRRWDRIGSGLRRARRADRGRSATSRASSSVSGFAFFRAHTIRRRV